MIPLGRDEMRGGIILVYWNKSRLMIQQNITIFLGDVHMSRASPANRADLSHENL